MLKHFALLLILVGSFAATADAPADIGPELGTVIPHRLELLDQHGDQQSFDSLKGDKGAVIIFYRSADWCPFCQIQMIDLNMHAAEKLNALGYTLLAVSYDAVEDTSRFSRKWDITFPMLSDVGSKAISAYGLWNPEYEEGHYAHGVPYPLVLITDTKGTVKAKLHEASYRKRPPTELILETVAGLE